MWPTLYIPSNWDSSLSDILARLDLDAVDRTLFAAGCRLRLTLFTGTFSTASTSSLAALTFSRFVLLVCFRLLTGDCLLVGLLTCLLACLLVCLLGCLLLDLPLCERAGDTTGGLRSRKQERNNQFAHKTVTPYTLHTM